MRKSWSSARDEWLGKTSVGEETSSWAIESINKNEKAIYALEELSDENPINELDERLKILRKTIKTEITTKENNLDDLALNTANSSKLQVSVPSSLSYLMKAWAAAEGRDLSSVALQCLENGLRTLKSKGSIPPAAIERYDHVCEKRIALAEINNVWERYESSTIKSKA